MKKTKLLITAALVFSALFIFSACKKGGDDPAVTVVGTWEVTHDKLETLDSTGKVVDVQDSSFVHGKSEIAVFNANNTYTVRDYSAVPDTLVASGAYSLLGNDKLVLVPVGVGQSPDTSAYTVTATTLTLVTKSEAFLGFTYRGTLTLAKQ